MPYRVLVTNVPSHVGEEEFYDYVRAHVSGEAVVNALLIMRPGGAGDSPRMLSSGAALVDYATKNAVDAARRVDFYVDGVAVMMKYVGAVGAAGRRAEALAEEGREAYRRLQRGAPHCSSCDVSAEAEVGRKRRREVHDDGQNNNCNGNCKKEVDGEREKDGKELEVELRIIGIPCDVYGSFLAGTTAAEAPKLNRSAVDLFTDVALSIRRATLGELLSLRRTSDDEAVIRVFSGTADALLERAADNVLLDLYTATSDVKEHGDGRLHDTYGLVVCNPRPHIEITSDNFTLAKKHEVLEAMARMMAITNTKVAGFIDPFGNVLFPSVY